MRRALRLAAAGALALCAFAPLPAEQAKIAAHYTNNDPVWAVFRKAVVGEDRARGQLTARFPAEVAALEGKAMKLSGFMTPLEAKPRLRHFILTRRSTTCPFCPPNAPTEAVEVTLDQPIAPTDQEVTVTGRLSLVAASDEGLFYRLSAAAPAPRG